MILLVTRYIKIHLNLLNMDFLALIIRSCILLVHGEICDLMHLLSNHENCENSTP